MKVWGFSGTRRGRKDFYVQMTQLVELYGLPEKVVVGDAAGLDGQVRGWCKRRGITCEVKYINRATGSPQMFWDRNQEIADALPLDCKFFAFPDEQSSGTYDCANRVTARNIEVIFL